MIKKFKSLLGGLAIAVFLTGCGSNAETADGAYFAKEAPAAMNRAVVADAYYDDAYAAEESYSEYSESDSIDTSSQEVNVNESAASNANRKLIRDISMTVETVSYDELVNNIFSKVTQLGGYAESMDESVNTWQEPDIRTMNAIIRVPKDKADELVNVVSDNSNVTYRSESVEDVTLTYVDIDSKKKSLQTEYDRLLELLERAETVEEIITIEDRLSSVRYQIESMESQLRTYDDKVDYTTLRLTISEVERIIPVPEQNFFSRVSVGFMESFIDVVSDVVRFIENFIIAIPRLILWAIIIFLIWFFIIRNIIKRSKKKKAERQAKKEQLASEAANRAKQINTAADVEGSKNTDTTSVAKEQDTK